jgi:hypothetical protein
MGHNPKVGSAFLNHGEYPVPPVGLSRTSHGRVADLGRNPAVSPDRRVRIPTDGLNEHKEFLPASPPAFPEEGRLWKV